MCLSHTGNCKHSECSYLEDGSLRIIQKNETHSESIKFWIAIYSGGVLDPYYFNNEKVRKGDFWESLNTYVRTERHKVSENAVFRQ